ncbi:glycosyltransferase family 2 protein [Conexibacter sp. SYSU D00693]|uniref:glycosyltransferase family 2 protein n=1 Tax=Conexibacter sp. SYSU D00693 TaxID=2812560 RepID=UPI00196B4645|nr:glycosyltransferase [Conexibacter sp. SYSU D00693]
MPLTAAIIVPTRDRAGYLDVALASLAPQAARHGAELVVVDDGPSAATRDTARRHGARLLAHDTTRGLNAARNTAIERTDAPLLCFVDDDVRVRDGWLAALLDAHAREPEDVGVLTGPILARFEDHLFRTCGREGPPVTHLDAGPRDTDVPRAWGANLTVRRAWVDRIGPFDATLPLYGDEQEWQERLHAAGGRVRYVAEAALEHRRAGDDARLRSLCRAARARGRAARREDVAKGTTPSLAHELRVLVGCAVHGPRLACMNGPVLTAHSLGRLEQALRPTPPPPTTGVDDFLSGQSGTVGGRRGALLAAKDRLDDLRTARRRARLRAAAATDPRRRVLALSVVRPDAPNLLDAARAELEASHHDVELRTTTPGTRGKFENLNALLDEGEPPGAFDWLLVLDDDVALPAGALDVLLHVADEGDLRLAQPAHRAHSHAAWPVTRRDPRADWRETTFVEIGPVTLFHRDTFSALLPFPAGLRMGWGLDSHWAALAREHGWRLGIVDAVPVAHTLRPTAADYPREAAAAEARSFLRDRPYVTRDEVTTVARHRAP